jgi:hypothetical protein
MSYIWAFRKNKLNGSVMDGQPEILAFLVQQIQSKMAMTVQEAK